MMSDGGSIANSVTILLDELVSHLRRLNRPAAGRLGPGAATALLDRLSIEDPGLRAWFGWANGVASQPRDRLDDLCVVPGYLPVSLDEGIELRDAHREDTVLDRDWCPLLTTGAGDLYAAIVGPWAPGAVAGTLKGEPTEIEFGSITEMLVVFNACYAEGAFFVDEEGHLALGSGHYDQVHERIVGPSDPDGR